MAYIIGTYNRYEQFDREHSKYVVEINGQWYAVKEVELEWGVPKVPLHIDQDESSNRQYCTYGTYEEAMRFVRQVKSMNAR